MVRAPLVVMILVVTASGCLAPHPGTAEIAAAARIPEISLVDGPTRFDVHGPVTLAVWVETDGVYVTEGGLHDLRVTVAVEGPPVVPFVQAFLLEESDGTLRVSGMTFQVEQLSTHYRAWSEKRPPERSLIIFGVAAEGTWTVTIGPTSDVRPNAAVTRYEGAFLVGPRPAIAAYHPKDGYSTGVEITDSRSRQVLGAYTDGRLSYRADVAIPGKALTLVETFCHHEGEGRMRARLDAAAVESTDAIYRGGDMTGTFRMVRPDAGPSTFELAFEPIRDPLTVCAVGLAAIPLRGLGINAQVEASGTLDG